MRGDRPSRQEGNSASGMFTPHARGSTPKASAELIPLGVYPACAGIDLELEQRVTRLEGLPRMRGDRPEPCLSGMHTTPFTPHARGSTRYDIKRVRVLLVYPACAGIDPNLQPTFHGHQGLPRMRGDRPCISFLPSTSREFTPHARGSTL